MTGRTAAEIFGARVLRERKRRGWSTRDLQVKAGISSPSLVNRMERGLGEPGLFRAARVAAAFGVSLDDLIAESFCQQCDGMPPAGFTCQACGTDGTQ